MDPLSLCNKVTTFAFFSSLNLSTLCSTNYLAGTGQLWPPTTTVQVSAHYLKCHNQIRNISATGNQSQVTRSRVPTMGLEFGPFLTPGYSLFVANDLVAGI